MELTDKLSLDKSAFQVVRKGAPSDEREYWLKCSPEERLNAVELLRQINYGYDPSTARLQRITSCVRSCAKRVT